MNDLWQIESLKKITEIISHLDGIKSIILVGSMATEFTDVDCWSDIDLKIILDDDVLNKYYPDSDWINSLGDIFSKENHENKHLKTSRICLKNFHRFDITFIPLSSLDKIENWEFNPFYGGYKIIKNSIDNLPNLIKKIPNIEYKKPNKDWLLEFENNFWHKVNISIVKLVRNDLLISTHLAFDLIRDCLVLKMILRDRKLGTNIHRVGKWGNDYINELPEIKLKSKVDILKMIDNSSNRFDTLMLELNSNYIKKSDLANKWLKKAESEII